MSRISLAAALASLLVAASAGVITAETPYPETVAYAGQIVGRAGAPLEGSVDLQVRYLDATGSTELYVERQSKVTISAGRFQIDLGSGDAHSRGSYPTLQEAFAHHAEVLMEVSVDGQVQSPWVKILPAGHSAATRAALSGPVSVDDDTLHWKGYAARSSLTGVQAVVLGPADLNAVGPVPFDSLQMTNPYQGEGFFLGESFPLRDQPTLSLQARPDVEPAEVNRPRHEDLYDSDGKRFGTATEKIQDRARASAAPAGSTPGTILNFEGLGNLNSVLPPDTEGAVGPNHYVQAVNLSFAIFNKSGTMISGPFNTNTLWSGFGGACQTDNSGDAIFLYDEQADRFVLTQFAVNSALAVCFAVSTTPDPTGSYYLYQFNTLRFPDYFKLGVWPDPANNAYFMSTNSGLANQYDVYAFDRARMLQGLSATFQAFQNHRNLHMPADLDGMTPPPTGTPGILYTFRDGGEPYFGNPPTDSIDIWEFDVDWATPANSTYTNVQNFIPPTLADFNWTVCGFFVSNCLGQPNTTRNIDSASWWPMQRLVYRNFGSHETLLGSWTVDVTGTPDWAGIRWFELRRNNTTAAPEGAGWTLYQQGTHAPDNTHRFMPSIAMDRAGNIAVGYSVTSETTFPSIRYATRSASDPLGTFQSEAEMRTGTGSQTHSSSRWGDYSSMEVDPADGCTFWFTTEYLQTTGNAPWKTRVGTFRVPGCTDYVFGDDLESGATGAWDLQVD